MRMSALDLLLEAMDRAYDRKSWHGPNLRGSVRRVDGATAAWRPGPARHNIWEHAVHCAYWKYIARRRLLGEKRGSFPLKGSNWFVRPGDGALADWDEDVALLEQCHGALRAAVADLRPAALEARPGGSKYTNVELLLGVAAHDVYHAGQIQLLKRLAAVR